MPANAPIASEGGTVQGDCRAPAPAPSGQRAPPILHLSRNRKQNYELESNLLGVPAAILAGSYDGVAAQRVVAGRTTYLSGTLRQAVTVATHMARVLRVCRSWMETYLNVQTIGRTCPISGQEAELMLIFNAPRWFGLMSARLTASSASTPSWMSGKS